MSEEILSIPTPDGEVKTYVYRPAGLGPLPGILFFMDGLGIRPAVREMAERVAADGYYVLLPNLFYRAGPIENLDPDKDPIMDHINKVFEGRGIRRDIGAFLEFLEKNADVKPGKIGCTGYCMGGYVSLVAAGEFGERIGAAASIHGGHVATDDPLSPHRKAHGMRGKIYVAVSEIDTFLEQGETDRLKGALEGAAVSHMLEMYPTVEHGFAVPGSSRYDKVASERHWDRILGLFKSASLG